MAFNPELGSTSPAVLLDNAERLDKLVNGPAADVPDRGGDPLYSWRQIMAVNQAKQDQLDDIITSLDTASFTFSDTTAGLAGTTDGQYFRVPQGEDSEIAFIYYRNNSGVATIVATTPSEKLISNSIGHDEDSSLIKTVTPDNEVTSLQTESGEIFIAGMSESIQEMASRSGKDNTTNLHSATDKDGLQLIITDAEGKIRIPLTDFPLQDLLAQVQPVS
ncbi:hypothetical protein FKK34_25110, partial [Klebsiella quasipneumoniae]|nr:hypothetical protein [Klebsiella quasipneumoniae]MBK3028925.1 hypothetical protein [Klebsiella quasipneumoniae]